MSSETVGAADPGADRRHRGMRLAESAPQQQSSSEDDCRGAGAEDDTRSLADLAAVHGQREEENDPEQSHDAAGPGQRTGAEQVGRVHVLRRLPAAGGASTPVNTRGSDAFDTVDAAPSTRRLSLVSSLSTTRE
jgi:hypothetical protein